MAELALGIVGLVGVIDVAYRYGKSLVRKYQALKHADLELSEHIVRVETCWMGIEMQLHVLRSLDSLINESHGNAHRRILEVLVTKLRRADEKLSGMFKEKTARAPSQQAKTTMRMSASASASSSSATLVAAVEEEHEVLVVTEVRHWKYARGKDGLIESIRDLEEWQRMFNPTWFLLMLIQSPEVDTQLEATAKSIPMSMMTAAAGSMSLSHAAPATTLTASTTKWTLPASITAARKLRGDLKSDIKDNSPVSLRSILLRPDGLDPTSVHSIPFCPASSARRTGNGQLVLLDPVNCTTRQSVSAVVKDIRNFARKLQRADPFTMSLLECKGILKDDGKDSAKTITGTSSTSGSVTGLHFVFRLPSTHPGMESLRYRMLEGAEEDYDSLTNKIDLARQLVSAVSVIHTFGFVHKNIRPETVVIIRRGENTVGDDERTITVNDPITTTNGSFTTQYAVAADQRADETAVLVGFDVLRNADGNTRHISDNDWEKNLYRHPSRQGSRPAADYEMRHDIYSVGVCLLEIGLWGSFVGYPDPDNGGTHDDTAPPVPAGQIGKRFASGERFRQNPEEVKEYLLDLTRGPLKRTVGAKYSKIVETCLTCLDKGNLDFGDEKEFQDEDGVAVGVRYIEKVVERLGDIAL